MVGLEFSLRRFLAFPQNRIGVRQLADDRCRHATDHDVDVAGTASSERCVASAAAAAMSSTALVSRQLADERELHRHGRSAIARAGLPGLRPACRCWPCWRSGARGESPKIESVLLEALGDAGVVRGSGPRLRRLLHGSAGLGGAAGATKNPFVLVSLCVVVAAAAAASPVGVHPPPWVRFWPAWCWARATSVTIRKATSNRFGDVLSGVFFVTIGLQLDGARILSAPLTVLAWLAVLVPVEIVSKPPSLAGDAPVRPRCPAHGHQGWGMAASSPCCWAWSLQHLIPRPSHNPCFRSRWCSAWPWHRYWIRHHDAACRFLSRTGGVIQPPG